MKILEKIKTKIIIRNKKNKNNNNNNNRLKKTLKPTGTRVKTAALMLILSIGVLHPLRRLHFVKLYGRAGPHALSRVVVVAAVL